MISARNAALILLVVALSGCGNSRDSSEDYDEKIKKAQRVLEKNYNNPKTHTYLGILYEKRGLTDQAEKHYRIAVELDPKFLEAMINLGNLYYKERDFPAAIQVLQMALEQEPNDAKIHYLLATVYKESRQYEEALRHYGRVLEIQPDHVLAQNFSGVLYYELREFAKAEEAFKQSIALDAGFADAYGNLGILYDFNVHDKRLAIEYYEKFLNLKTEGENVALIRDLLAKAKSQVHKSVRPDPDQRETIETVAQPDVSLDEVRKLAANARFNEALAALESYTAEHPGDDSARILRIVLNSKSEPVEEAGKKIREAVQDAPDSADLWYALAQVYDKAESIAAVGAYERALQLSQRHPEAARARERMQALAKEVSLPVQKAPAPDEIVVEKAPVNVKPEPRPEPESPPPKPSEKTSPVITDEKRRQSQVHFNYAAAFQMKGQNAQAIAEYEKAIQLNPANAKAHYNLGILYKWQGAYDRAIKQYQLTIQLDPRFARAYYNLGIIFKSQGKIEEALGKFLQAVQIDPRYPDAYLGIGTIYSQDKRDPKRAAVYYKKYLHLSPSGPAANKIRQWLRAVGESG